MKTHTTPTAQFAKAFKIKSDDLYLAHQNPSYSLIEIPKKNGDLRKVYAPCATLKKVQRKIAEKLNEIYEPIAPKNVMGFIRNNTISGKRDIVANAKKHKKSAYLVNIDIKDFFSSCTARMVEHIFIERFSMPASFMQIINDICFLNGSLPPGSPTSPVLSNIILLTIDNNINKYCKEQGIIYTRYVDDLTFSSIRKITKSQLNSIAEIIAKNGFHLNAEKTIFYKKGDIKEVTGIAIKGKKIELCESTVEEINGNINYYHQWKQKILRQFGAIPEVRTKISKMQKSIKGQLNFAKRIDGEKGKVYTGLKSSFEGSIDEKDFNFKLYI